MHSQVKSSTMKGFTILIIAFVLSAYLLLGALLFQYLEQRPTLSYNETSDNEGATKNNPKNQPKNTTNMEEWAQDILTSLQDNSDSKVELNRTSLGELFTHIFSALSKGTSTRELEILKEVMAKVNSPAAEPAPGPDPNWTLDGSVLFVITVVTTIGYGATAPETDGGKLACAFYALFGIPLCMVFLSAVGRRMHVFVMGLINTMRRMIFIRKLDKKCSAIAVTLCSAVIVLTGILIFVILPGFVIANVEGWTNYEGVYYAIITLTTIGFGDYVVGQREDVHYFILYKILTGVWIFVGLAWLSTLIQTMQIKMADIASSAERLAPRPCLNREFTDNGTMTHHTCPCWSETDPKINNNDFNSSITNSICEPIMTSRSRSAGAIMNTTIIYANHETMNDFSNLPKIDSPSIESVEMNGQCAKYGALISNGKSGHVQEFV